MLFDLFDRYCSGTWRKQKQIMLCHSSGGAQDSGQLKQTIAAVGIAVCFLGYLYTYFNLLLYGTLFFILLETCLSFRAAPLKTLTSARAFCKYATAMLFTAFLAFLSLATALSQRLLAASRLLSLGVVYVIICLALTFLWCRFCLLANTSIASLVNLILTALFTVLNLCINFIFSFLSTVNRTSVYLQLTFHVILLPLLIVVAVAAAVCELKKYWITKYNFGNDINPNCVILQHTRFAVTVKRLDTGEVLHCAVTLKPSTAPQALPDAPQAK